MPQTAFDLSGIRSTRAIVDLDAIGDNVQALRSALPETTRLMAIVKADGYGHGAPWVARAALDGGAVSLGVATVDEGRILRAQGFREPIVLLGSIDPSEAPAACRAELEIAVADRQLLEGVQRAVRSAHASSPVAVHLKIDTGLRRYGAMPDLAPALASQIAADVHLHFAGVFTHFASADEPGEPFTREQLHCFEHAVSRIREAGVPVPPLHAANSAGILTGQGAGYAMARAGIALYGVPPSADVPLRPSMRPAMRIESRITRIVLISPGDSVGYNRTFRARQTTRGALIPIGYGDGYRRSLSGRAWVGVAGRPANVIGRVSMDQLVVELPADVDASVGDTVYILGDASLGAPSVTELAELMETNTYEVLVGIRQRVPRVYVKSGACVGVRTLADVSA